MNIPVNSTIATYIQASNNHDIDTLISCFNANAIVIDEGRTYQGIEEIRQWITESRAAYSFTLKAIGTTPQNEDGLTVVTCRVTGTFPGSPVDLSFFFTLQGDSIVALTINVAAEV